MEQALYAVQTLRTAAETAVFFWPLLYLESLGMTSKDSIINEGVYC